MKVFESEFLCFINQNNNIFFKDCKPSLKSLIVSEISTKTDFKQIPKKSISECLLKDVHEVIFYVFDELYVYLLNQISNR